MAGRIHRLAVVGPSPPGGECSCRSHRPRLGGDDAHHPHHHPPPFDPELSAVLAAIAEQLPSTLTPDMIEPMRTASITPPIEELFALRPEVTHREETVAGYEGAELLVSSFTSSSRTSPAPGFFHTHGGGMIIGDRFTGIDVMLDWVERLHGVCVEYRLSPEFSDPYPVEDCYAALVWTAEHAAELGIDPDRLIIAGGSAGGGLAAGTTLLARDRSGPVRAWPARC